MRMGHKPRMGGRAERLGESSKEVTLFALTARQCKRVLRQPGARQIGTLPRDPCEVAQAEPHALTGLPQPEIEISEARAFDRLLAAIKGLFHHFSSWMDQCFAPTSSGLLVDSDALTSQRIEPAVVAPFDRPQHVVPARDAAHHTRIKVSPRRRDHFATAEAKFRENASRLAQLSLQFHLAQARQWDVVMCVALYGMPTRLQLAAL